MNKTELQKYIAEAYSTVPDFPWESTPDAAVYRHENNRKWFALVMTIPKARLGIRSDGMIDIVNLKCDPLLVGSLRSEPGIFPAYHMNKDKWLSVALDGSADDEQIKMLLDMSFELTAVTIQRRHKEK
ncbi:MAG: MmcQ/YjbR family DNA-binding protein [Ruminococcus sp.]|jgi:predicted DNA-binding protein (MmcQ/YjbR family)|nr:MmcQ/YjbR family DNA-binding protein [Ruminococcus sp.]MBQ2570692.1 MmcQ/YjbR family DNA-binding protein [Ruminococcus sp.]MBQ5640701.1 MmcQ/YjbR family DNA-binding protein [Ruminococcus sp.]